MGDRWPTLADEVAPTTLIVVGFVLFVVPEPATSTLGAGLLLLGASWWFYEWHREWRRGRSRS